MRQYNDALSKSEHIQIPHTESHKACDKSKGICDTSECHVFHQYTIKIKNVERDKLVNHFNEHNILHGVYYPIPLHLQKAYKDERYDEKEFTITNTLVDEVISLPMHTELDKEQIDYITSEILKVVG